FSHGYTCGIVGPRQIGGTALSRLGILHCPLRLVEILLSPGNSQAASLGRCSERSTVHESKSFAQELPGTTSTAFGGLQRVLEEGQVVCPAQHHQRPRGHHPTQ